MPSAGYESIVSYRAPDGKQKQIAVFDYKKDVCKRKAQKIADDLPSSRIICTYPFNKKS